MSSHAVINHLMGLLRSHTEKGIPQLIWILRFTRLRVNIWLSLLGISLHLHPTFLAFESGTLNEGLTEGLTKDRFASLFM